MKLIIVFSLFPLFYAQQTGFLAFSSIIGFRQAQGYPFDLNNIEIPSFRNFSWGTDGQSIDNKKKKKNNLPGLEIIKPGLLQQLTNSLMSAMQMYGFKSASETASEAAAEALKVTYMAKNAAAGVVEKAFNKLYVSSDPEKNND